MLVSIYFFYSFAHLFIFKGVCLLLKLFYVSTAALEKQRVSGVSQNAIVSNPVEIVTGILFFANARCCGDVW